MSATVVRITHLGLCVSDLERSVAFYRDALGMTEDGRLSTADPETATLLGVDDVALDLVYLVQDGLRLELLSYASPGPLPGEDPRPMNRIGFTHLSIRVDDVDAAVERIIELGGRVLEESRVTFHGRTPAVMALDPDGTRLELLAAVPA